MEKRLRRKKIVAFPKKNLETILVYVQTWFSSILTYHIHIPIDRVSRIEEGGRGGHASRQAHTYPAGPKERWASIGVVRHLEIGGGGGEGLSQPCKLSPLVTKSTKHAAGPLD